MQQSAEVTAAYKLYGVVFWKVHQAMWTSGFKTSNSHILMMFQVLKAAGMKMATFRVVVSCSLQYFRGAYSLHHQDNELAAHEEYKSKSLND
jgi:hypothetical protein